MYTYIINKYLPLKQNIRFRYTVLEGHVNLHDYMVQYHVMNLKERKNLSQVLYFLNSKLIYVIFYFIRKQL
jgi:hypothetical protein